MKERQYCASAYTIDFENENILLVYNKKLQKWLQPGGHIIAKETPIEAAIRETLEETGIFITIIGPTFDGVSYQPIAVERYINSVGDMIDTQYLAVPLSIELSNQEGNIAKWFPVQSLENHTDIDEEIKLKVLSSYQKYKYK